jgi:hypothetical protein
VYSTAAKFTKMQSQGLCPVFPNISYAWLQTMDFFPKILDFALVWRIFFGKILKSIAGIDYQQHYKIPTNNFDKRKAKA